MTTKKSSTKHTSPHFLPSTFPAHTFCSSPVRQPQHRAHSAPANANRQRARHLSDNAIGKKINVRPRRLFGFRDAGRPVASGSSPTLLASLLSSSLPRAAITAGAQLRVLEETETERLRRRGGGSCCISSHSAAGGKRHGSPAFPLLSSASHGERLWRRRLLGC